MRNMIKPHLLRLFLAVLGAALLAWLMLRMTGALVGNPIVPETRPAARLPGPRFSTTARAQVQEITDFEEAVGTVRPRSAAGIEAQVTARVLNVMVRPGEKVTPGMLLILLDSREFQARLEQVRQALGSAAARRSQARQGISAARAAFNQAEADYRRIKTYFASEAATAQQLERAEAAYHQAKARLAQAEDALLEAEAGVRQAEKAVEESSIALGYTRIHSNSEGWVLERLVEPGDLALPGKPLLVLQTRGDLRLEAVVPERLIHHIREGDILEVAVEALGRVFTAVVEERLPSADPITRTFLVKVALPRVPELLPGMFGRLRIPVGTRRAIVVPSAAVRRIGQLEMVYVENAGRWEKVHVRTGKSMGDKTEILTGLRGGEIVAVGERADDRKGRK